MFHVAITAIAFLAGFSTWGHSAESRPERQHGPTTTLADAFRQPGEDAKPWVYWYWLNADVTREGITRDLEAMAETGVGGAYIMTIGHGGTLVATPANALSEPWWELVVHATKEAKRLGLRLAMNACDGWALAGGPWITPELSMQEVTMSTRLVGGGVPFVGKLDQPMAREKYYRDIAVLAYPVVEGTDQSSIQLKPKATTNIPGLDPQQLVEPGNKVVGVSAEGWIQYEFAEPFTCRSIRIAGGQNAVYQLHRAELQVSDDGKTFRSLGRLTPTFFHGWEDFIGATHSIPPTTARFFRFVLDRSGTPPPSDNHEGAKNRYRGYAVCHIELSSRPRIDQWEGKAGYVWRRSDPTTAGKIPDELYVPRERIIDLTGKMAADGTLEWTPPAGRWVVQRIGYTSTGTRNGPAGAGAGLEADKFSAEAARTQFNGWFGEALKRVGPELAGKALCRNHLDSWECGSQNWSPGFRKEFIQRCGYDPVPWLPTMNGVPIGSAELSERFLYDVRSTAATLVCDNFYKSMEKLGRDQGCGISGECLAPTMISDGLQFYKHTDVPMGEFWRSTFDFDKPNDVSDAISGGHIYGKRIIGSEAFTTLGIGWTEDPFCLKSFGDYHFANGVNQFMLHVWCHQPFDKPPGVTLHSNIGAPFGRTQTWLKPGKAWFDYLRRSSSLLQQGLPVADVCYFIGEDLPSRSYLRNALPVPLPEGYAYDSINRDALLTRATARDGRLVLPDGVSYRLLVLPPSVAMTPELAQKIGELAQAGVPVIGVSPSRSISLVDYPKCDETVRQIVKSSWGKVRNEHSTKAVLDALTLKPDVEFPGVDLKPVYRRGSQYLSPSLVWNHRTTADGDLYFISNQEDQTREVEAVFRIAGRVPELWDAATGEIRDAGVWHQEQGRTSVSLRLAPAGSVFVVFRREAGRLDPVAKITPVRAESASLAPLWIENGTAWTSGNGQWQLTRQSGKTATVSMSDLPAPQSIAGPWTVKFSPGHHMPEPIALPALRSLSEHADSDVKHFSGTAGYETSFELSQPTAGQRLFLDLGKVVNLAEVTVNGKNLGVLWKPPYLVEVTDVVKAGGNTLRIDVTNTWKNRLIGDESLPPEKRTTITIGKEKWFKPGTPLEPSGLLGPVSLQAVESVRAK